ncbi:MAG: class I SAM-dependent methyltransferase [Candidatus Hydrogenedentota bacterium]
MDKPNRNVSPEWYTHAFGSLYPILYAHRSVEAAKPEALFAAQVLELTKDQRVLDLCCGNARHIKYLREYARYVVGLDYSPELLRDARDTVEKQCPLVRADMREVPFTEAFDAITNFFTSFGYFVDPLDNFRVISGLAEALKPGGRFFIDHINRENALKALVPESFREHEGYDFHDRRWFDAATNRLSKRTTLRCNQKIVGEVEESVQLYSRAEFEMLLSEGGLRIDALYGDYTGAALDAEAPRMIAVGVRE